MEPIKMEVTINVSVDLSQNVRDLICSLLANPVGFKCEAPVVVEEETKPAEEPQPKKRASRKKAEAVEEAKPVEKETEPVEEVAEVAEEVKTVEEKTESVQGEAVKIDIEMVRQLLASKVNEHRNEIKAKLTELGAPSVTKLDPDKYHELYLFLSSL